MQNTIYRAATVGMFDGVHRGHSQVMRSLQRLASDKGMTATVFTFDRHPYEVISPDTIPFSITTPAQKAEMLIEAGAHDVIIMVFNAHLREMSAREFMQMLHDSYSVRLLLIGYNHRLGHDTIDDIELFRQIGAECGVEVHGAEEFTDDKMGESISSSAVRKALIAGDIARANTMLGHRFAVRGKVERGRGLGRKIGFPTANISTVLKRQLLPAKGVYSAIILLADGELRKAVVNIGNNPTVTNDPDAPVTIEAHIPNFDENIYGQPIEVQFVDRIRDEKKFESVDALAKQIEADCKCLTFDISEGLLD